MLILTQEKTTLKNYLPPKGSKIAVCMSGGVDSSVSAYLLHKKGYEVIGLTGWLIKGGNRCCDGGMVDAAKVSEQLGIKHISKDLRVFFRKEIIDPFIGSYSTGSTPIPCITCNNIIKWGSLMEFALNELGCTHIATGHYAKLIKENEYLKIMRSNDTKKDQTFMLWGLTQEVLTRTVFPLGDLDKEEVRKVAREGSLTVADKEESQDICFVNNKEGTQGFLAKFLEKKEGAIIENKTGKVIGNHEGIQNFTIGQRKGLGIAYSEPLYVIKLDVESNVVYAGTKDELEGCELNVKDVSWICPVIASTEGAKQSRSNLHESIGIASVVSLPRNVMAKIRYNSQTSPAKIEILDGDRIKVTFDEPQSAITPGQACVFYDESDQILLGGGWIC